MEFPSIPKHDKNWNFKINPKFKEILLLDEMLTNEGIPHELVQRYDGWQVIYPNDGAGRVADAIEFFESYGHSKDKLELMGLLTQEEKEIDKDVTGFLTAEDVFVRFKKHWEGDHR